ncbi:hypothetical protein [Paludibacterium denitrificans]|uniref:hypothetical protein n=1 Tax=Paludibacterium denitrificans TaxID=2675226 RepID=UPI001E29CA29|nr:hypothetical protein [Paludibacterium denitrificans]
MFRKTVAGQHVAYHLGDGVFIGGKIQPLEHGVQTGTGAAATRESITIRHARLGHGSGFFRPQPVVIRPLGLCRAMQAAGERTETAHPPRRIQRPFEALRRISPGVRQRGQRIEAGIRRQQTGSAVLFVHKLLHPAPDIGGT